MYSQDEQSHNHMHNHEQKAGNGSRLPWLLVIVLGALLVFQYFGTGTAANSSILNGFQWSSLLFLLCPLMMVFMMFGHNHSGGGEDESGSGGCCGGHQHGSNEKK